MPDSQKFVYLRSGEKCRVLSYSDCHSKVFVAIRIALEQTWGDECTEWEEDGKILCIPADDVFDAPPTQVLSKEIKDLNAQIAALKAERYELKHAVANEREQYEQAMTEYAQFSPALARLDEFIRLGEITHYFVYEKYGTPEILSIEDTFSDRGSSHPREGRLLTLTSLEGRTLTWVLNQYRDGSGSGYICTPCTSHQEALDSGQEWIKQQVTEDKYTRRIIQFAREHSLILPDDYIATVVERERGELTEDEQGRETKMKSARHKKEQEWEALLQE